MFKKENIRKNFLRVKQTADQKLGRWVYLFIISLAVFFLLYILAVIVIMINNTMQL